MEQSVKSLYARLLTIAFLSSLIIVAGKLIEPAFAISSSQRSVGNNTFATRMLIAPTNLSANPAGHDVSLSWNAGQNGNGYAVLGVGNGTNSNCTGVTFGSIGSAASTSYNDTGRYLPQGTFFCYQVKTSYGTWTSQQNNPVASAQIGVVASSVQMINGGTAGRLDPGDRILLNFNQAVDTTTGPSASDTICAWGNTISLASSVRAYGCGPEAVVSGSYTGNGVDGRAITGLSFTPDVVIIKDTVADVAVMRTSTMVGDVSKPLVGNTALVSNRIQSFQDFGFTVGNHATVNTNGTTYHWIAFKAAAGEMVLGSYPGNGIDNRSITGIGFQPDLVVIAAEQAVRAVYRPSSLTGDQTLQFDNASAATNLMQAFEADGFQIGTDTQVNQAGSTYHYIAWKKIAGKMNVGSYTGNGADNRSITGVGFQPEYVIVNDLGGATNVHKPASTGSATDTSLFFTANNAQANRIQALQTDGFQVGTNNAVNGLGRTYYWIAFARLEPPPPSTEPTNLGRLAGGTVSGCNCRYNGTFAWSNGNKTLTVTVGTRVAGYSDPTVSSATWTFTPVTDTAKLKSAAGGFHVCDNNSGGGNCLPSTTSGP